MSYRNEEVFTLIYKFLCFFLFLNPFANANLPSAFRMDQLLLKEGVFVEEEIKGSSKIHKIFASDSSLLGIDRHSESGFDVERLVWENGQLVKHWKLADDGSLCFYKTYDYDLHGRRVKQSDWGNLSGRYISPLKLDSQGNLLNGESYSISYVYSLEGLLVQELHDNGKCLDYHYDRQNQKLIAHFISFHGQIQQRHFFQYDQEGREIVSIVDDGCEKSLDSSSSYSQRYIHYTSYPSDRSKVCRTFFEDSSGSVFIKEKQLIFDNDYRLIQELEFNEASESRILCKNEYSDQGLLISRLDAIGQQDRFFYDVNGLCKAQDDGRFVQRAEYLPNGDLCEITEDSSGLSLKIVSSFNEEGRLLRQSDIYGNIQEYQYDGLARLVLERGSLVYDSHGQLISPQRSYHYNSMDLLAASYNEKDEVQYFSYNSRGQEIKILFADGSSVEYEYELDGSLRKTKERNGLSKVFERDYLGRVTLQTDIDRSGKPFFWTQSKYDAFALRQKIDSSGFTQSFFGNPDRISHVQEGSSDCLKNSYFSYDAWGRLFEKKEQVDSFAKQYKCTRLKYDLLDRIIEKQFVDGERVVEKIVYAYDRQGRQISMIHHDADGQVQASHWQYNILGRVESFTNAVGDRTLISFDFSCVNELGQRVLEEIVHEPIGRKKQTTYDVKGRPSRLVLRDEKFKIILEKEFLYDACGNLAKETERLPSGDYSSLYGYNASGKIQFSLEGPEKRTDYSYNKFGDLIEKKQSDGSQIFFSYDEKGQLINYYDAAKSFDYAYDFDDRGYVCLAYDLIKQSKVHRCFNAFGYLTSQSWDGLKISYQRDFLGRKTELILPDQSGISYQYDAFSLLSVKRLSKDQGLVYSHNYLQDPQNYRNTSEELIDACSVVEKKRDAMGRYLSIKSPFWNLTEATFNCEGLLCGQNISDAIGSYSMHFSHDSLSQLATEQGPRNQSYSFDSFGNCKRKDQIVFEFDHQFRLLKDEKYQYQYDACGNIIVKQSADSLFSFSYDALGRLIEWVKQSERKVSYTYDPFDRRIGEEAFIWKNGDWTSLGYSKMVYDGNQEIASFNEAGKIQALRVLGKGLGQEIGAAVALELEGHLYMPIHDQRGSIVCLVDPSNQKVMESYRYSSFGEEEIYNEDLEKISVSNLCNPWRFMSKRVDDCTGFVFFGRREYDPKTTRWLSPDPLGRLSGRNAYLYCHNKPLDEIDLLGHFSLGLMWQEILSLSQRSRESFFNPIYRGFSSFYSGAQAYWDRSRKDGLYKALYLPMPWHQGVIGKGEVDKNLRLTYTHGIRTDEDECRYVVSTISRAHGNVNFHYLGQTAIPFSRDMYNAFLVVHMGVEPPVAKELAKKWKSLFEEMGPEGRIIHYAHSHGGKITFFAQKYLSQEERAKIEVRSFGSACIIDKEAYSKVMNYVSCLDPFPIYCDFFHQLNFRPFSTYRCFFLSSFDHVTSLEEWLQKEYSVLQTWRSEQPLNHSVRTPICSEAIATLGRTFIEKYGCIEN